MRVILKRNLKKIGCFIVILVLISIYLEVKVPWKSKGKEIIILHFQKIGKLRGSESSENSKDQPEDDISQYKHLGEKSSTNFIELGSTIASTFRSLGENTPSPAPTTTPTPSSLVVDWRSFSNLHLDRFYQMAYASPDAHATTASAKKACLLLGCAALTIEKNGWVTFFRNVPTDRSKWFSKPRSTLWVVGQYLDGTVKQPAMHYGCSRHEHACKDHPDEGTAPCCAHVMLEIMLDLSRVLRKHGIHWRLAQGQQLSVVRDGILQLFDHDFDPQFESGTLAKVKHIIESEMHLAGKSSKYREADYYYTKKLAAQLKTNWSKYSVMGGDFDWTVERFRDPHTLQRNPVFMDVGQSLTLSYIKEPTKDSTFPCMIGVDILCSRQWFDEVRAEFGSGYQKLPHWYPPGQAAYSGHSNIRREKNNLMFDDAGAERNSTGRDEIINYYISKCPEFWTTPCSV